MFDKAVHLLSSEVSRVEEILTSPSPSTLVSSAQPPQSVYAVMVFVCCLKVQSVSNEGCLNTLIMHVGSALDRDFDADEG